MEHKALKFRLKEVMEKHKIKTPKLSKQTNIPKDRIYKWYSENSNPKTDDAEKLEMWIAKMEKVPRETTKEDYPISTDLDNEPLEQAILNLSETDRINARNIERLITLLEVKVLGVGMSLPTSQTKGTKSLVKDKKTSEGAG